MLVARAIVVVLVLITAVPSVVTAFAIIGLAIGDKYRKSRSPQPAPPPTC
jgi:hypothetical protein